MRKKLVATMEWAESKTRQNKTRRRSPFNTSKRSFLFQTHPDQPSNGTCYKCVFTDSEMHFVLISDCLLFLTDWISRGSIILLHRLWAHNILSNYSDVKSCHPPGLIVFFLLHETRTNNGVGYILPR